jgi:hypothetical protein
MAGQRAKNETRTVQTGKTWDTFIDCEENNLKHLVRPSVWPPSRIGITAGEPSVSLQCERCSAWCITYAAHATGALGGVEVIVPVAVEARPKPVEVG